MWWQIWGYGFSCHPKVEFGWQTEVRCQVCHQIRTETAEQGLTLFGFAVAWLVVFYNGINGVVIVHADEAVAELFGQGIVVGGDDERFSSGLEFL